MLKGVQEYECELTFSVPSVCAQLVEAGAIDLGLVPVAEIERQKLEIVGDTGIAAYGAVRSILLISTVPFSQIRTLAVDSSSRTSVQLARVLLRERFGATPQITQAEPDLSTMLMGADACLIIGDPALRIDLDLLNLPWLDLGAEWLTLTNLPFVFAAWAGKPGIPSTALSALTNDSYRFGAQHLNEIARAECSARGISEELARRYLSQHLRFEIGVEERKGLEAFLELAGFSEARA